MLSESYPKILPARENIGLLEADDKTSHVTLAVIRTGVTTAARLWPVLDGALWMSRRLESRPAITYLPTGLTA